MITCHKCKRELPESDFYEGNLKRGYVFCKDCCKEWGKESKKRYIEKRKSIKNYKETCDFNKIMGGYVLTMLYQPKENEFKYCLHESINNNDFFTNSADDIKRFFEKALEKVTANGQKKN